MCSPFNQVAALDPATGRQLWRFDPKVDRTVQYPNSYTCRGVAYWADPAAPAGAPCAARIFMNAVDRRLFALDAASGKLCAGFGSGGVVDTGAGIKLYRDGEMQITSPPVVARGVVVVGSSIDDNQRVREVTGAVRAYDAVTGKPKWTFDPLAGANPPITAGAANVWAPMSVDEMRGLVFLPTTSPSPDFWGGLRPGDDGNADSVVAVKAETGEVAWAFKTVHHDVWDYDNPAQPTLAMVAWQGAPRPAVLQPTKQGLLFTLDRDTGKPIIPVVERPVPQGGRRPARRCRPRSRSRSRRRRWRPAASRRRTRSASSRGRSRPAPRRSPAPAPRGCSRRRRCKARSSIRSPAAARIGAGSPSIPPATWST